MFPTSLQRELKQFFETNMKKITNTFQLMIAPHILMLRCREEAESRIETLLVVFHPNNGDSKL